MATAHSVITKQGASIQCFLYASPRGRWPESYVDEIRTVNEAEESTGYKEDRWQVAPACAAMCRMAQFPPCKRNHGLITGWRILGILSNPMERRWGLEPQTSTVSNLEPVRD